MKWLDRPVRLPAVEKEYGRAGAEMRRHGCLSVAAGCSQGICRGRLLCLLLSLWCGGVFFWVKKLVVSGIVAIFAVTFGRMRSGRRRNVRVRCGFGAARARAYQGVGEPISLSVR